MSAKTHIVSYTLLLAVGVFWGSQFLFNELAIASLPPGTIAAGRALVGCLTLAFGFHLWSARKEAGPVNTYIRLGAKIWRQFFLIGLFEATLPYYLIIWGQQRIDSGVAAILTGTTPIFAIVLAALFAGERMRLGAILSVALGFVGVVILIGPGALTGLIGNIAGELAVLLGAFFFAISFILIAKLPAMPAIVKARNGLFCASLQLIVLALIVDRPWQLDPSLTSIVAVLALGAVCAGAAYSLFIVLVERRGAGFASLTSFLVPVFGVILGVVVLAEPLKWTAIAALAVIILALLAHMLPTGKERDAG